MNAWFGHLGQLSRVGLRRSIVHTAALAAIASLTVLFPATQSFANGKSSWTIVEVFGKVSYRHGTERWLPAPRGLSLAPGASLRTGSDGRARLESNGDMIVLSPGSDIDLPVAKPGDHATGISQKLGTLLYKIVTRKKDRFAVKTPYLAAVIKGTTFTVTVDNEGAALHVTEGAVQVRSNFNGQSGLIRAGQTGKVFGSGDQGLKIEAGSQRSNVRSRSQNVNTASKGGNGRGKHVALGRKRIDIEEVTHGLVEDGNKGASNRSHSGAAAAIAKTKTAGISGGPVSIGVTPGQGGSGTGSGDGGAGASSNGVAASLTGNSPPSLTLGLGNSNGKGKGKGNNN